MTPRLEILEDRLVPSTAVTLNGAQITPFPNYSGLVRSIDAHDVDGDGVRDLVVVATGSGGSHAKVFSGATGRETLSTIVFQGWFGDVAITPGRTGPDGSVNVAFTAFGEGSGLATKVFSGRGDLLASVVPYQGYSGSRFQVTAGYNELEFDTREDDAQDHHEEYHGSDLTFSAVGPYDSFV